RPAARRGCRPCEGVLRRADALQPRRRPSAGDDFRVVQLTPPGSACSVTFGKGITTAEPGSVRGLHLVVADIVAAREELVARGVGVSEIRHMANREWRPGPDPQRADYGAFADFG